MPHRFTIRPSLFVIPLLLLATLRLAAYCFAPYDNDVGLYFRTATSLLDGQLPYRDFPCEYPPLALPVFLLPRLLTSDVQTYFHLFAALMSLCVLLTGYVTLRIAQLLHPPKKAALLTAAALTAFIFASGPLLVLRFDIVIAFTVATTALLALQQKWDWAGLALGTGIALKLWPLFLLPPLLVLALNGNRKNFRPPLRLFLFTIFPPLITHSFTIHFVGPKLFSYLTYHSARGLEIESLPASLIALIARLTNTDVYSVNEFGAPHLHTAPTLQPLITLGLTLSYIFMLLTPLFAMLLAWKSTRKPSDPQTLRPSDPSRIFLFTITALILSAKVLSVQYLFWLFPFALLFPPLRSRSITLLLPLAYILALSLAQFWFPNHFEELLKFTPLGLTLLLARNFLLILILLLTTKILWTTGTKALRH